MESLVMGIFLAVAGGIGFFLFTAIGAIGIFGCIEMLFGVPRERGDYVLFAIGLISIVITICGYFNHDVYRVFLVVSILCWILNFIFGRGSHTHTGRDPYPYTKHRHCLD